MRAETRLDWATFQLDEARSRCELWVAAGSETEKLASGSLKPFLAHLKEAQEQISRGQTSIKLQLASPGKALWFTKGTMERFVRFVTTPDVLERLSIVEMERRQLEEAINILAVGEQQIKQTTTGLAFEGEDAVDGDVTGDNSKNQLLVAMDARRIMLHKEQLNAFNRAAAAGFDMACMADMVDFADCFGATRLREACLKFASICKRMQEKGQLPEPEAELLADTASSEDAAQKARTRKTWMAQEMAADEQQSRADSGHDESGIRAALSSFSSHASFATPVKSSGEDFRAIPDSPPNIADADSPSTEGLNSQHDTPTSRRLPRRVSSPRRRSSSPMRRVQLARSGSKRGGMVVIRNINYTSPGSPSVAQPGSEDDSSSESDSVMQSEEAKDALRLRRLSVQDAIHLFEQKQKDSLESQSAKSEPRRASLEPSSSGKSVLRRWSSIGENTSNVEAGKASGNDEFSQSDQAEEEEQSSEPVQHFKHESPAARLEERRKSWITAQNDLEWKFQQLKLQEAALPAVRSSSRESTRSPQQKQVGANTQFGFQYRGQKPASKAPVSRSWSATSEKDLVTVVRQAEVETRSKNNQKPQQPVEDQGRFYEQYRERRDAKIRQESNVKKAERESKLKAMQEMLDKRKAELVAGGRSAERQSKAPAVNKKAPQSGRTGTGTSTRSPIVSASQTTPRAARQQLTPEPKNTVARKLSPGPQKPPSSRGLSSSPKLPKTSAPAAATQRRPSNIGDNPLSRSMPSLSELRKENTRPARSSQQSKAAPPAKTSKPGSNIVRNSKALSKVLPLEPNGVTTSEAQVLQRENTKRKTSSPDKLETLAPLTQVVELQTPAVPSSIAHDTKSFLRKGRGIGPGAGPGVLKQKAATSSEPEDDKSEAQLEGDGSPVTVQAEAPVHEPRLTEAEPVQLPGSVRESQEMDIDEPEATVAPVSASEVKNEQPMEPVARPVIENISQLPATDWSDKRAQMISAAAAPSKLTLMQQLATEEQIVALQSLGDRRPSVLSIGSSSSPCSSTSGAPVSQLHPAPELDGVKARKKWGYSEKPVITQQGSKEGPKGFKRLLKFGRKSRGNSTSEWVSASTTSEGEDTDESRDTGNSNGSSYLRRSTEAFSKDSDGNGSRSFFSLSSFRSKSSELKAKF